MKIYLMLKKSHEKTTNHQISIKLLAFLKTFLEREETFAPIPRKHSGRLADLPSFQQNQVAPACCISFGGAECSARERVHMICVNMNILDVSCLKNWYAYSYMFNLYRLSLSKPRESMVCTWQSLTVGGKCMKEMRLSIAETWTGSCGRIRIQPYKFLTRPEVEKSGAQSRSMLWNLQEIMLQWKK